VSTGRDGRDGRSGGQQADRVGEALRGPLADLGLDVEAVEVTPAGKRRVLRVAVDRDGGVTLDDVADATRAVGSTLDDSDVMGEQPYTLEVTSRGVDRPLTEPRHWRRNTGRLVKVTQVDGSACSGRVVAHDEDPGGGVVLEVSGRSRRIAYAAVARALVQVEFNRPAPAAGTPDGPHDDPRDDPHDDELEDPHDAQEEDH